VTADTVIPNNNNTVSWNRYTYVRNNPIIYKDPSGNIEIDIESKSRPANNNSAFGTTTYSTSVTPTKYDKDTSLNQIAKKINTAFGVENTKKNVEAVMDKLRQENKEKIGKKKNPILKIGESYSFGTYVGYNNESVDPSVFSGPADFTGFTSSIAKGLWKFSINQVQGFLEDKYITTKKKEEFSDISFKSSEVKSKFSIKPDSDSGRGISQTEFILDNYKDFEKRSSFRNANSVTGQFKFGVYKNNLIIKNNRTRNDIIYDNYYIPDPVSVRESLYNIYNK